MTKEKVFISEADQYLCPGDHYDIYKNWVHLSTEDGVQESISEYGHQMQHR